MNRFAVDAHLEQTTDLRARSQMNIVSQSKSLMLAMGAAPVMWLMLGLSLSSLGDDNAQKR